MKIIWNRANEGLSASLRSLHRWQPGLIVGALAVVLAGCGLDERENPDTVRMEGQPSDVGEPVYEKAPAPDTLVESPITPTGEDTEVRGRVMVLSQSASAPLQLVVEIEGLRTGDHAWDLHAGSCTSTGPVALSLSETQAEGGVVGPLSVDQTGMVDAGFEVSALAGMVPSEGRYTLHVHEEPGIVHGDGAKDPATVACARL